MTLPPVVTDMPPVECARGPKPLILKLLQIAILSITAIAICGIVFLFVISLIIFFPAGSFLENMMVLSGSLPGIGAVLAIMVILTPLYVLAMGGLYITLLVMFAKKSHLTLSSENPSDLRQYRTLLLILICLSILMVIWIPEISSILFVILLLAYYITGLDSVRHYYGLKCPECNGNHVTITNHDTTIVSCKACGTEWK